LNQQYPRAYRLRRSTRRVYQLLGAVLSALCLWACVNFILRLDGPWILTIFLAGIFGAFACLGAMVVVSTWRVRVTLRSDSLEVREIFATREAQREHFRGHCLVEGDGGAPSLRLVARPGHGPDLNFPQHLEQDEAMNRWLESLIDLDRPGTVGSTRQG
jgi:hypothetical protein